MVSGEFNTAILWPACHDRNVPVPHAGGNWLTVRARLRRIAILIVFFGTVQSAALGQPLDPFLARDVPLQAAAPYQSPAYGNTPLLAQNTAVPLPDSVPPSGGTVAVKPEEKKEGEKSGEAEKKDAEKKDEKEFKEERFNWYGQTTVISQWHDSFHSPYQGQNSFQSDEDTATSATATLMLGGKLWQGGELYFDPEIACGRGVSDVYGMAAFPNGDITRVGRLEPTPYVARLYASQSIGFGGEQENIEAGPNQLASIKDISRLTFTVGKFALSDFFDCNKYAHDPRSQFMNWALMYNPAWDYAADVRGYTMGAMFEINQKNWALRYCIAAMSLVANGPDYDPDYGVAHGQVVELESAIRSTSGRARSAGWAIGTGPTWETIARSLALSPVDPDITATRNYDHIKYGFGMNIEQELADNLGAFLRLGWNDGQSESWEYTECDRTISLGILLKGTQWGRSQDQLGTAVAIDGISSSARRLPGGRRLGIRTWRWTVKLRSRDGLGNLLSLRTEDGRHLDQPRLPDHRQSGLQCRSRAGRGLCHPRSRRVLKRPGLPRLAKRENIAALDQPRQIGNRLPLVAEKLNTGGKRAGQRLLGSHHAGETPASRSTCRARGQ